MAIQTYNPTTWEDSPSSETPINAANLNNMESGISSATAAIQELETSTPTKAADLELGTDAGYVTPRDVWKIIDAMFLENDLRLVNGKLVYTDIDGTDHVLGE